MKKTLLSSLAFAAALLALGVPQFARADDIIHLPPVDIRGKFLQEFTSQDASDWDMLQSMFRQSYSHRDSAYAFNYNDPRVASNELDSRCNQTTRNVVGTMVNSQSPASVQSQVANNLLNQFRAPTSQGGWPTAQLNAWFSQLPTMSIAQAGGGTQTVRTMNIIWFDGTSTAFRINGSSAQTASADRPYPELSRARPPGESAGTCPMA